MSHEITIASGIRLCYETFGDPSDPALLLEIGLGGQMVEWEPAVCENIAAAGFYFIRYDRRDTGLATKFEGTPDIPAVLRGDASTASYTLYDMADDAIGLLDALGVRKTHLLGASMGSYVSQALMIRYPERILSACLVMTTTGARDVGARNDAAYAALIGPRGSRREDVVEAALVAARAASGSGFALDEDRIRRQASRTFDRMYFPSGRDRHIAAIAATGDRTELLRQVRVPTVVIHGTEDPIIDVSGGKAVAAAIEGSKLVLIPGMGHGIPREVHDILVEELVANAARSRSV